MTRMTGAGDEQRDAFDDKRRRLDHLLYVTERHRLLFLLLTASPKKPGWRTLIVDGCRRALNKIYDKLNREGWTEKDLDLVFTYQSEINDYAKLIDMIVNPEPLLKPAEQWNNPDIKEYYEIAQIAPGKPWLTLLPRGHYFLEESAASIWRAVEELMAIDISPDIRKLVKRLKDRAFPGGRGRRFRTSWCYVQMLDMLIGNLQREVARLFSSRADAGGLDEDMLPVQPALSQSKIDDPVICEEKIEVSLGPLSKKAWAKLICGYKEARWDRNIKARYPGINVIPADPGSEHPCKWYIDLDGLPPDIAAKIREILQNNTGPTPEK